MKQHIVTSLKFLVLAALIYMPIFGHLDGLPIRKWDEGRVSMNAYEMLKNGDYIVTHAHFKPDMWNTKPPFLIWCQVISMKCFGVNEVAIRLPSAFAAFFTSALLMFFSLKYFKSFWYGFIAVMVLITSQGYISIHGTRTGDYDALLTLFTTVSCFALYSFVETKQNKYLYWFFGMTALAVLTKSITGVLFFPGLAIYSLTQTKLATFFKNKHFYIGLGSFLFITLGYYFLRESQNPGFLEAVGKNELGGRYLETNENNLHGFWFFYTNMIKFSFNAWHLFVPCGLIVGLCVKDKRVNRFTLFCGIMIISFFIVISSSQTKLEWYDLPLYPFLSALVAIFIYQLFLLLKENSWLKVNLRLNPAPIILLFFLGLAPYKNIIGLTYLPKEFNWHALNYEIGYYLQDATRDKIDLNNQFLAYEGYAAQNMFYVRALQDKGVNISFKNWKKLESGDVVIVPQLEIQKEIHKHYIQNLRSQKGNIKTYNIYGRK